MHLLPMQGIGGVGSVAAEMLTRCGVGGFCCMTMTRSNWPT